MIYFNYVVLLACSMSLAIDYWRETPPKDFRQVISAIIVFIAFALCVLSIKVEVVFAVLSAIVTFSELFGRAHRLLK